MWDEEDPLDHVVCRLPEEDVICQDILKSEDNSGIKNH